MRRTDRYPSGFISKMGARRGLAALLAALLAACAAQGPQTPPPPPPNPLQSPAQIAALLPRGIADRTGWAADIHAGFTLQDVPPTRANVCAVLAVIGQESNFVVDPPIPGLGAIAWREIHRRAERAGIPWVIVHTALELGSPTGATYAARIDRARTEHDLSDVYEDFVGIVPLGEQLFADHNPIRTRGPMQVNVAFARKYAARRPYPYPIARRLDDEVFTRRGSLYFGIAHLLAYRIPDDAFIFRFADYNAGQYASRNAALQAAIAVAAHVALVPDGALLPHDAPIGGGPGATELALDRLAASLGLDRAAIHAALELERSPELERTALYQRVFALAERGAGRPLPRARIPQIELHGPKIEHRLTTRWYANRVDERYRACLAR